MNNMPLPHDTLITLTTDIVAAHVSNNTVSVGDVSQLITNVHAALNGLSTPIESEVARPKPAVPIRASIKPDYIVCLEDGKKLKMLKRHLMACYQMTPEAYRAKWGLPQDYPMTAPNYTAQRKELAHKNGLGHKPKVATVPAPASKPRKLGIKTPAAVAE